MSEPCEHPKKYARGMCWSCWGAWHRGRPPKIRAFLAFVVRQNCILCGDGMGELRRKCRIHPRVCNVCHAEYCECQVQDNVELLSLEDIAQMPDDEQIGALKARKITLRLAGKRTNSLPFISNNASSDDRVGHTPQPMHIPRPWGN